MKSDLLKEAIADAKAVKETALANAKMALEEAFAPKLQSMLSHKLAEELEDDEEMTEEEEEMTATTTEMEKDEMSNEMDSEMDDEMNSEMDSDMDSDMDVDMELDMDSEEGEDYDLTGDEEEDTEEDDLDLESIIAELEAALEGDDEEVVSEEDQDMEMTKDEEAYEAYDSEEMTEEEEELDINEIIRTLKEMADDEEMSEEEMGEEENTDALEEAYQVIESLKKTINEVNLLNAKLLYTNKLFRTFDLNEGQKMKVIENFDRAASLREVKLVYATLGENLNVAKKPKTIVKESLASKPTKSSAPKKSIISEGTQVANRFKKLAGLIK
jgi:hypothetical protein